MIIKVICSGYGEKKVSEVSTGVSYRLFLTVSSLIIGSCITFMREVPGSGIFFLVRHRMDDLLGVHHEESITKNISKRVLSGGTAGLVAWCSGIPLDTAKSIIQTSERTNLTSMQVLQELYDKNGVKGLYRGVLPTAIRTFPSNATLLLVYEFMKNHVLVN